MSELHPLIERALAARWDDALLRDLLDAWRVERTSDLADVIRVLGDALDGELVAIVTLDDLAAWPALFERAPSAALRALSTAANDTFGLLADENPGSGSPLLGAWLDATSALGARWWRGFTDAIASLRDHPPDPRIGRALLDMLASPSDHWFRVDQVAHVAGPFETADTSPSFADVALARMERDADAGTSAALEEEADAVLVEADCNGAAMSDCLRELAAVLRERHVADRTLDDETYEAIRARTRR